MGNNTGKKNTESQPATETGSKSSTKGSTKHVSLLVLHDKPHPQQPEMIHFCRALNACEPLSSIAINADQQTDFMFSKVPDDGLLPESEKKSIETWVSKQLTKGHIILICLLKDCNIELLTKGTIFENNKKLIVFCFKSPPINRDDCICIDTDFENTDPGVIKDKMTHLANTIRDETLS